MATAVKDPFRKPLWQLFSIVIHLSLLNPIPSSSSGQEECFEHPKDEESDAEGPTLPPLKARLILAMEEAELGSEFDETVSVSSSF